MAYKKNIDDLRESPSMKLVEQLVARGAKLDYHDPYIPQFTEHYHGFEDTTEERGPVARPCWRPTTPC
jgi:UDP-N-acetyl-D-mannosaminuronate dehydrogenase